MNEHPYALVYRGGAAEPQFPSPAPALALAGPSGEAGRIGFWDLSLLLGDLPPLVTDMAPHVREFTLYTVTAAVPAGMVTSQSRLATGRLLPQALRVARSLQLERLIALTPYPLTGSKGRILTQGPVAIVSLAPESAARTRKRQSARRALEASLEVLPAGLAAAMRVWLEAHSSRRPS